MSLLLSPEQIEQFQKDGAVLLKGVFDEKNDIGQEVLILNDKFKLLLCEYLYRSIGRILANIKC